MIGGARVRDGDRASARARSARPRRRRRPRKKMARFGIAGNPRTRATDERKTHREDPQHVRGYAEGERRGHRIVRASRDGTRGACAAGHGRTSARTCTAEPPRKRFRKRRFTAENRSQLGARRDGADACRAPSDQFSTPRMIDRDIRAHSEWRAPPDGSTFHETRPDRLTVAVT